MMIRVLHSGEEVQLEEFPLCGFKIYVPVTDLSSQVTPQEEIAVSSISKSSRFSTLEISGFEGV